MNFKSVVILTAIFSILMSTSLSYADEKIAQPSPAAEKSVTPPPAPGGEKQAEPSPLAVIPEDTYNFPMAMEGVTIIHDFTIQNKGNAELEVLAVKPG
jgi:hypothetical protein